MTKQDAMQWRCNVCGEVFLGSELLSAPSPFEPDDTLTGCPACKQCDEGFAQLCDEPGCFEPATCGWPSGEGYRRTCGEHYKRVE